MSQPDPASDPVVEEIPNPETGVGIGTDTGTDPNTFEPEEDPDAP